MKIEFNNCWECGSNTNLGSYRVTDNNDMTLCNSCYDWYTNMVKSGIPTTEQIKYYHDLNNEYKDCRKKYLLLINKHIKSSGSNPQKTYIKVLDKECELSISLLKKDRSCIDFKEHIFIMEQTIEDLGFTDDDSVSITEKDSFADKMILMYNNNLIKDNVL